VVRARKGEFVDLFAELIASGYARARIDGEIVALSDAPKLKKQEKHTIEVVVDRLSAKPESKSRLNRFNRNCPQISFWNSSSRFC
jgi:excinuclease ABC subunit A